MELHIHLAELRILIILRKVCGRRLDAIAVGDNPPSNPVTGALWFDSSVEYIYYNDGSSSTVGTT